MDAALADYVRDWKSAGDTSEDYWRTWLELHEAHWDGLRRPRQSAIPLDPLKIHIIGTLLKIGRYRSSKNYLTVAKTKHIEQSWPWGPELELASRRFHLSTQRGAGPPRQSEPLNFEEIILHDYGWDPIIAGGPVNSIAVIVLFTFFSCSVN